MLRCDVELIVVNTPDATHYPLCRAALEAGKHVIVEKPFVTTIREAKELIEIADRKGLMLITYQNRRWDGDFLTLQQIVRQGSLGRLVEIQSSFQRYRPRLGQSAWKETPGATRVGITYNLCSHLCDQIVALLGKPEGVWATLDRQRDGSRIDDYSLIVLEYPGIRAQLRAGMLVREPVRDLPVYGTNGAYVKYGPRSPRRCRGTEARSPLPATGARKPVAMGSASRRARPTRLSDRNGQLHAFLRPGPRYAARGEGSGRYA